MADSLSSQLINQARRLARLDPRRPKQGNLRRAVSSAYYALFHHLVEHSCRCILGTSSDRRPYRNVLARAFEHGTMAKACKSFAGGTLPPNVRAKLPGAFQISVELRTTAEMFVNAQEWRHEADYDLSAAYSRSEVLAMINSVEQAISRFLHVLAGVETKFFLACLLAWGSLRK